MFSLTHLKQASMDIDMNQLNGYMDQAPDLLITYGAKLLLALAIYIVGGWVAKFVSKMLEKALDSRSVDRTITVFVRNLLYYIMLVVVIIAALGQLGVQTASFVAIIGAAGLAVGFALQGSLSNFAAGVMLIMFRPCKVGDFVEAGGAMGVVSDISIFATTILTGDNKTITIANSSIMGGNIVNYSTQEERRIDMVVGVSYNANIQQVKDELAAIAAADERVLTTKDVTIGLAELADSSINFVFRPWVKSGDYWPTKFDLNEKIKNRFDELGIEIPYPQMDVHVQQAS
ncbi:mechanosensitive ion channel family protein [Aurantivibrio plasticivorans]